MRLFLRSVTLKPSLHSVTDHQEVVPPYTSSLRHMTFPSPFPPSSLSLTDSLPWSTVGVLSPFTNKVREVSFCLEPRNSTGVSLGLACSVSPPVKISFTMVDTQKKLSEFHTFFRETSDDYKNESYPQIIEEEEVTI